jgi:hypothetical protein
LDPNFEFYPYPRIDFGTGDSPLRATGAVGNGNALIGDLISTDWTTFVPANHWERLAMVAVGGTISVTYPQPTMLGIPSTTWGNRIQIPLFEAGVAIVLNVGGAN